ncbi:MAG: ribonuclease PH [Cyanobacteria bacterium]|nr:ribonuclease PH [Cyanobacteriota bacterium]
MAKSPAKSAEPQPVISENQGRPDGRDSKTLRPVKIQRHFTKHAHGSVLIETGDTRVLVTASVEERVPRHVFHSGNDNAGWITAEYALLPGSTNTRSNRERLKVSGRTTEIQRLIGRCLRASFDLSRLGQRTITVDADVLQADAGTRVAAITGAYVAVVDALRKLQAEGHYQGEPGQDYGGLPILSPIAAVSVGVIDGDVRLDLTYEEDSNADVDANIVMNARGELIEFQASTEGKPFSRVLMTDMLDVAESGIQSLLKAQEAALSD